jgi:hypothetical protein
MGKVNFGLDVRVMHNVVIFIVQGSLADWGRISTVDLLVLTSLDQLIFILKILFSFLQNKLILTRRSTVLSLPPQLVFPACISMVWHLTQVQIINQRYLVKKAPRLRAKQHTE